MLRVRGLTSSPAGVLGLGLASIEMAIKAERDETEAGEEERKKKTGMARRAGKSNLGRQTGNADGEGGTYLEVQSPQNRKDQKKERRAGPNPHERGS